MIRDEFERVLAFRILGNTPAEDRDIPAVSCRHVFDPMWHDTIRGIPSGAAAIKLIYGSLTSTEREQLNQNMRSSYAFVEYNETGGPNYNDPSVEGGEGATATTPAQPTVETLAGGMIKYFRSNSGGKIEVVDNDMPGDGWDTFQDRMARTHSCAVNWPYELYWKSEKINSALVRNIQERARMSVEDRQDVLKSPALLQIRYAVAVAIKIGILPKPKNQADWYKWDFFMPRKFSIDPGRDAQQRREDYKMGLRNRTGIISEEGCGDIREFDRERIAEVFDREDDIRAEEKERGYEVDRRLFYLVTANEQDTAAKPEALTADPENDPDADDSEKNKNDNEDSK